MGGGAIAYTVLVLLRTEVIVQGYLEWSFSLVGRI